MKRFVKCFFELLTQNFSARRETGRDTVVVQMVKGLRVEIFSRSLRKNTTRPLTVWIVGTDVE